VASKNKKSSHSSVEKTKSRNIIREIKEDEWECDGIVGKK
jgi:hypothetical protein